MGSAEANETRGFVHLYVRRGLIVNAVTLGDAGPSVAVHVRHPEASGDTELMLAAGICLREIAVGSAGRL